jgi:hypothetical protein
MMLLVVFEVAGYADTGKDCADAGILAMNPTLFGSVFGVGPRILTFSIKPGRFGWRVKRLVLVAIVVWGNQ